MYGGTSIMKRIKPNYFTAVHALVGGGVSGACVDGSISENVFSDGQTPPTESAIQTELSQQLAEYDAQDYARARETAYPQLKEFAEAYTEKEIGGDNTKWNEYVTKYNKVRTDNPKE